MKARSVLFVLVLIALTAFVTSQVVSQDSGKPEKTSGKGAPTGQPSPEQAEMMKKMMELCAPGEQHKMLAKREGTWDYKIKFKMDPTAEWENSTGTSTTKMVMGGRFLHDATKGVSEQMGTFEGTGFTGFDNISKKFVAVWFDNMSTSIATMEGTADATGKIITFAGTCNCPMEGGPKKIKSVLTTKDDNNFTYQGYSYDKSGKEWLGMEITYTRAAK
ncbi:MAG: DUF1579 domain-containing protein [Planctomycetes bacterium]|nr:DUF1579 domain-containing protein [Planctomycetota bacterium]